MTFLDVFFRYGRTPGDTELRALDEAREVYGIRRISFEERQQVVSVEYDASRLNDDDVAFLLRSAGLDVREKVEALQHPEILPAA
jgi:hypothetical protein